MHRKKYSIDASEDLIEIYGDIDLKLANDFFIMFSNYGFTNVIFDEDGCTLIKKKIKDEEENLSEKFCPEKSIQQQFIDEEIIKDLESRNVDLNLMLRQVILECEVKFKLLIDENNSLRRCIGILRISGSKVYNDIILRLESQGVSIEENTDSSTTSNIPSESM